MYVEKKIILVVGADGQLGSEFKVLSERYPEYDFHFTDVNDIDITKNDEVFDYFRVHNPDICINCAAYTAVDKAEEDQELAYLINSTGVKHLSVACQLQGTKLIHFSTDYVYDSISGSPLLESDSCTPKSVYGFSKRAGEEVLEQSSIDWICLRVSWLYGSQGHNFVRTMIKLGNDRDSLSIVADQIGAPTYAGDLADVVMYIIKADKGFGHHYNFSNSGVTNWADFAREIMDQKGLTCDISDTTTAAYGAKAPRPLWSVMSHDKIKDTYGVETFPWQESLKRCLSRYK